MCLYLSPMSMPEVTDASVARKKDAPLQKTQMHFTLRLV